MSTTPDSLPLTVPAAGLRPECPRTVDAAIVYHLTTLALTLSGGMLPAGTPLHAGHTTEPAPALRVADLGGNDTATLVTLAREGHHVTVLVSDHDVAERIGAAVDAAGVPGDRVATVVVDRWDRHSRAGADFDVVLCHELVAHVAEIKPVLAAAAALARRGGVLSITGVNALALATRAAARRDWPQVLCGLHPAVRDGRVRPQGGPDGGLWADHREQIESVLAGLGVTVKDWYGHQSFTSADDREVRTLPAREWAQMVEAEAVASRHRAYRQTAPRWQVVGARGADDAFRPTVVPRPSRPR